MHVLLLMLAFDVFREHEPLKALKRARRLFMFVLWPLVTLTVL